MLYSSVYNLFALSGRKATFTHYNLGNVPKITMFNITRYTTRQRN